jgi:hypothetical protein
VQKTDSPDIKKRVSDFFDKLKLPGDTPALGVIIPITPKMYNAFIDGVRELVLGGISLTQAMQKVSARMINSKEATPKEAQELRRKMNEDVNGEKKKSTPSEAAKELKEATDKYNLAKELEKERERFAKIRESDNQARLESVEKQLASLAMAQREEDKAKIKEAQDKAKELKKLDRLLEKERERIEALREKEEQARRDNVEKRLAAIAMAQYKEAMAQLKENEANAQKARKELEAKVKELTSKVISEAVKGPEAVIDEIIDMYLDLESGKEADQKVVDMVKEKFPDLSDATANAVAKDIINGVAKKIKDKLARRYASALSAEEKAAKKENRKQPINPIDELIRASKLGVLDESADAVINLFQNKYGIAEFTVEDVQQVKAIANQIAAATTPERKNQATTALVQFLAKNNPFYFAELLDEFWYFNHLSSVLTGLLGTADVNNTFNLQALLNNTIEMPLTAMIGAMRMTKGQTVSEIANGAVQSIMYGFGKSIFQQMSMPKGSEEGIRLFSKVIGSSAIKDGLLSDSITYLRSAIVNGLSPLDVEKPFENMRVGEFEIRNWFEKARNGDREAESKIAKYMFLAINAPVRAVPRILGGSDVFFGTIVKNAYVPTILRAKYYKQGLRGKALSDRVLQDLLSNEQDVLKAKELARLAAESDYDQVKNAAGTWDVYYKGKIIKSGIESLADATQFSVDHMEKTFQYKKDLIYFMNQKIGDEVMGSAGRIAQRDLLSGPTEAGTSKVYSALQRVNRFAQDTERALSKTARNRDSSEWKAVYNMLKAGDIKTGLVEATDKLFSYLIRGFAIIAKYTGHLVAFMRVGLNLIRLGSNYLAPIGVARYVRALDQKGLTPYTTYKDEMTMAEQDKILAQAIFGTAGLLIFTSAIESITRSLRGDDDEEENVRAEAVNKKFKENNPGEEMPKALLDLVANIRPGDVIGSFEFLKPAERNFYNRSGIIKENSVFKGVDSNGNYIYDPILGEPALSFALVYGTYRTYLALGDKEETSKLKAIGWGAFQPLSSFFDMSIGQGIGKQVASNKSLEDKAKSLLQTLFLDQIEVLNPDIVTKPLQYWDKKYRPNQDLFDFIEQSDSFRAGAGSYLLNKGLPLYGSVYRAMLAPQAYGMFGEELYKIPAQGQGGLSNTIAKYMFSDKNLEQKAMYDWLGANGFTQMWAPPKSSPFVDANGKAEIMSSEKRSAYGREAGQKTFKELQEKQVELQALWTEGEDRFVAEVRRIFKKNYLETYMKGEGIITDEMIARFAPIQEGLDQAAAAKKAADVEKRIAISEAIPLSSVEKSEVDLLKRQKGSKAYKAFQLLKSMNKVQAYDRLVKYRAYEILSNEEMKRMIIMLDL